MKTLLHKTNSFLHTIRVAVKCLQSGMALLHTYKDEIIKVLKENHTLAKTLVRLGALSGFFSIGCKAVTKKAFSLSLKSASKVVKFSSPVSLAADAGQVGLEIVGCKKIGQCVGVGGNIVGGAMLGSIAGPPGVAVGALCGFTVWIMGEAAGRVIDKIVA